MGAREWVRECMGAKLQSHIPAQVNMGYIFRKKNMGPLHPRFKEKRLYFSRTISKKWAPFPAKMTPNNGYESSRTLRQTQMRVCHPTLFPKLRALDLCLFAKGLPPPRNRQDKCYWSRLLKQGYWSLHKQWKGPFFTLNCQLAIKQSWIGQLTWSGRLSFVNT